MSIGFFISNHGFGHLMRNLPVMKYLLLNTNEELVLICSQKHNQLAKEYLTSEINSESVKKLTVIDCDTDIGLIVKAGSLEVDLSATENAVREYIRQFNYSVAYCRKIIDKYHISKAIIDIVLWAIVASKEASIPSYLMASFTWIEQYENILPKDIVDFYKVVYKEINSAILLGLANKPTKSYFCSGKKVDLVAREFHTHIANEIRRKYKFPIVFLSIGGSNSGIATPIEVGHLPYFFIATSGLSIKGNNVLVLDKETKNTQDYILASDYCISKAGWSTVSEILLARKPMALIQRPGVAEDQMLIQKLVESKEAIEIIVEELENMDAILKKMDLYDFQTPSYKNDFEKVSKIILDV